jgi:hypothetical protein
MAALICGSLAYDNIMVFPDRFKNHILPEKIHILNVCFMVPELRREFGGCAGNIAYNLKLLEGDPLPMGTVGSDFGPYFEWFDRAGIRRDYITVIDNTLTAQAFITTDLDDNQITAFHPGAMNFSHKNSVLDTMGVTVGLLAPDGREGMIQHAREFVEAGIPFLHRDGGDADAMHVVERVPGSSVTDFGAPDVVPEADAAPLDAESAERFAGLVAASWRMFDRVVAGTPATLRKGPRGGGRDRDEIVVHVAEAERSYARKLGVRYTPMQLNAPDGQAAMRAELLDALRAARAGAPLVDKGWPPRYAARRIACHVLDHAWEMEDKSG